jgi:hypothetical protein
MKTALTLGAALEPLEVALVLGPDRDHLVLKRVAPVLPPGTEIGTIMPRPIRSCARSPSVSN